MKKKNIKENKIKELFLNQKGMALLTTLIFVFILVTFAVALLVMTSNDTKLSALQRDSTKAFYIAEAGIEDAIGLLINGTVSDSGSEDVTNWNFNTNTNTYTSYTSTGFNNTFTIKHRLAGNPPAVDMNLATDKPYYIINSTGTSGRAKREIEVVISLTYTSAFAKALIGCNGVTFGSNAKTSSYNSSDETIDGNDGDVITTNQDADIILDSASEIKGTVWITGNLNMDSNAIVYKSANVNGNISMYSNSKIGAEDTEIPYGTYEARAGGDINIYGGQIYGNARVGGDINIYGGQIYGDQYSSSTDPVDPEDCDPLDIVQLFVINAFPIKENNDNDDLSLGLNDSYLEGSSYSIGSNDTDTIGKDNEISEYYLTGFETDSNAKVTILGDVTLYVDGNFSTKSSSQIILAGDADGDGPDEGAKLTIYITGDFNMDSNTKINDNLTLNNERKPSNVMVYSNAESLVDDFYRVTLDSNTGFRGVIYAPNAPVEINSNTLVYGSVRGSEVLMNSDADFQYDEQLGKITGEPDGYSLEYWREII